uniref:EXS domain-containing protein n=2 Tax=Brugia TaxID=6278 RepID=A0A0R3QMI2_9BILA
LVASVGSYMMYRVCARFLGKNFVWTILEQARFDLLTRNETYLLKPRMPKTNLKNISVGFYLIFFFFQSYIASDEYDSCCSADLTDDEQNSCDSHVFATVPSSACFNFYELNYEYRCKIIC